MSITAEDVKVNRDIGFFLKGIPYMLEKKDPYIAGLWSNLRRIYLVDFCLADTESFGEYKNLDIEDYFIVWASNGSRHPFFDKSFPTIQRNRFFVEGILMAGQPLYNYGGFNYVELSNGSEIYSSSTRFPSIAKNWKNKLV